MKNHSELSEPLHLGVSICLLDIQNIIYIFKTIKPKLIMRAYDYNSKEFTELIDALRIASSTESVSGSVRESIHSFFSENKDIDYNDFLVLYNEKYGNIIKQYREYQKLKAIKKIRFAASLYIVTFFMGLIIGILWYILS